jgi:hypothetical protein
MAIAYTCGLGDSQDCLVASSPFILSSVRDDTVASGLMKSFHHTNDGEFCEVGTLVWFAGCKHERIAM